MAREQILKALAVTAEITGTELSKAAASIMADDLMDYPEPQVLEALARCRREVKGRLTLADIISRLDDGRPGPEEAWAMLPKGEEQTVVWTEEIAAAAAVSSALDDPIAARMAFLETYRSELANARAYKEPVKWVVSLGWNSRGREGPICDAIAKGRLSRDQVQALIPDMHIPEELKNLTVKRQ